MAALVTLAPAGARASTATFGSPLAVPANRDTANDLNYTGTGVALPALLVHVNHDGADTALWNVALASGAPTSPAAGQILSFRIEGCAQPARGGPRPLTAIHLQDLSAGAGGTFRVQRTSGSFDLPVCGEGGAGDSTVTSYTPENFCVNPGEYLALNTEGGFDSKYYPSGVPYRVMASVAGSVTDSFIRNAGTMNGATFSPNDTTNHDGFASNPNQETLLQATVGSGPDATPLCPGGTRGRRPPPAPGGPLPGPSRSGPSRSAPSLSIPGQRDGVNARGRVKVALSCHVRACSGKATLSFGRRTLGHSRFKIGRRTSKVSINIGTAGKKLVRSHHRHLAVTLAVVSSKGETVARTITLR